MEIPKDFDSLERSEIPADIIENLHDFVDFLIEQEAMNFLIFFIFIAFLGFNFLNFLYFASYN